MLDDDYLHRPRNSMTEHLTRAIRRAARGRRRVPVGVDRPAIRVDGRQSDAWDAAP